MTNLLKLMLNAQVCHISNLNSIEPVQNSPLMEDQVVTYGERVKMENGDHSLLTTSGITTTVPKLFAETLDSVLVLEAIPEEEETKNSLIPKPEIEDVLLPMIIFFNAESTEDQTNGTSVLKLMLNAQEHHGDHIT
jgi:hypothetical protein